MDEQKKLSDIEEAAAALIANSEDENPAYKSINKPYRYKLKPVFALFYRFEKHFGNVFYILARRQMRKFAVLLDKIV